ncbi:hypothetical protein BJ138DRAFT_1090031 [Hygrophoropsis aurantiaca]|uniref:Uncharacterized protein n=1 Tax=Hygrophoropsis aurantiaca TaxID=72124 RepID=A0ACB8A7B8_9AGAM|nr:hypothetical protein BJ138DRAFT_1090031 [Hygrophoropsis aurantiaca]
MSTNLHIPPSQTWCIELSREWDVLGPFPIHAREQQYLSPSFPIYLSEPVDLRKRWYSSYADRGEVSWTKTCSDEHGNIQVSYPHIRWERLRGTEGWAALQHHSVLRTSITVFPPSISDSQSEVDNRAPRLCVELLQGSYFAIVPAETKGFVPSWYSGNIYAMERSPLQSVDLPVAPAADKPTKYELYVSGDYEIRLFGDSHVYNSSYPILSLNIQVDMETPELRVVHAPSHDIVCDFVDGIAFGSALGVGLRSVNGWWRIVGIKVMPSEDELDAVRDGVKLSLPNEITLAPSQTRIVPISLTQTGPLSPTVTELPVELLVLRETDGTLKSDKTIPIRIVMKLKHTPQWTSTEYTPIKASYMFSQSIPTAFLVLPPKEQNGEDNQAARAPILALHGAGVDIFDQRFWADSLARQMHSWVVMPSGRTSWGLDWHGPSAQDAWATVDALRSILAQNRSLWGSWSLEDSKKVVLVGHSNGGQGAWYLASRFPDRVLGVVPAAGYIKAQAYINLSMSRSAHFIDPSLRGILESSFTPDDNDLFLSNLVDTPVLAVHGADDDNVPTWHTREAVSVLKTWNPAAHITYREDSGQGHWYNSVLQNEQVQTFLDSVFDPSGPAGNHSSSFTLTVAVPSESGPLHGWRVLALDVPGRLARLQVQDNEGFTILKATNTSMISVDMNVYRINAVSINGHTVAADFVGLNGMLWFSKNSEAGTPGWTISDTVPNTGIPSQLTRIHSVLSTAGPLKLVIPAKRPSPELTVALRIAHDLQKFHKLESEITTGEIGRPTTGNVVIIGGAETDFVQRQLESSDSPFRYRNGAWILEDREFIRPSSGIIFLYQRREESAVSLYLMSTDQAGLERAARLFPIRTGVPIPDWVVVGAGADGMGAAGIEGAGVWQTIKSNNWKWRWNAHMSWLD